MTVTTEYGKQNIFAKEPKVEGLEGNETLFEAAEKANGRWAMIGMFAALGTYAFTGQLIPGIW